MAKHLVAFYWANDDVGLETFCCSTEAEAIIKILDAMLDLSTELSNEEELDGLERAARAHIEKGEVDEALQCIDTWCEEYNEGGSTFIYTLKEQE